MQPLTRTQSALPYYSSVALISASLSWVSSELMDSILDCSGGGSCRGHLGQA